METPQWTKDRPAESGYYWYREGDEDDEPEVVEWNVELQWVMQTGSDIVLSDDGRYGIDGEFWPEAIRLPNASIQP
jgi:hypothetical protein